MGSLPLKTPNSGQNSTAEKGDSTRPIDVRPTAFIRRPPHLFPSSGTHQQATPYQPPTGVSKIDSFNTNRAVFQPKKKKPMATRKPQEKWVDPKKGKKEVRFQLAEEDDEEKRNNEFEDMFLMV